MVRSGIEPGHSPNSLVEGSFTAAATVLGMPHMRLLDTDRLLLKKLSRALAVLENLHPLQKPRLLKALAHAVVHDGKVQAGEVELLRVIAQHLDCPVPTILIK